MSKFQDKGVCIVCGGTNSIINAHFYSGFIVECATECNKCGHKNYWCTGFFEVEPEKSPNESGKEKERNEGGSLA